MICKGCGEWVVNEDGRYPNSRALEMVTLCIVVLGSGAYFCLLLITWPSLTFF
jgi:hypothetical protein